MDNKKHNVIAMMVTIMLSGMLLMAVCAAQDNNTTVQVNNTTDQVTAQVNDTADDSDAYGVVVDDIEPYKGWLRPDHPFYGLKIALENIDEAISMTQEDKVQKKLEHARERIAEVKAMLGENRTREADKVMKHYTAKVTEINDSIEKANLSDTGVFHARKMIMKHHFVLQNLILSNKTPMQAKNGLFNALNNSYRLQEKFKLKIQWKLKLMNQSMNQTAEENLTQGQIKRGFLIPPGHLKQQLRQQQSQIQVNATNQTEEAAQVGAEETPTETGEQLNQTGGAAHGGGNETTTEIGEDTGQGGANETSTEAGKNASHGGAKGGKA